MKKSITGLDLQQTGIVCERKKNNTNCEIYDNWEWLAVPVGTVHWIR